MEFRAILRTRRKDLGLTLDEVGRAVGVSGATVSRWENGDIENIRRDKIAKLSKVLEVTPAYLMGWPEKDFLPEDANEVQQISPAYFRVMKEAKEKGYSPEDIEMALEFIERARRRDQQ